MTVVIVVFYQYLSWQKKALPKLAASNTAKEVCSLPSLFPSHQRI